MSGRVQTLMRTRCPDCGTIFRVTSEQLRLKAGKVRCGQCSRIFNAFDEFLPEGLTPAEPEPAEAAEAKPASEALEQAIAEASPTEDSPAPTSPPPEVVEPPVEQFEPAPLETATEAIFPEAHDGTIAESEPEVEATDVAPEAAIENPLETPEESTLAAREAGLVAARELSDTPGYNRWAAGTLAAGPGGFAGESPRHAVWPFVLVASLLLLALTGQLLYYFRSEVVQRLPDAARLFELAAIDIPLPRNVDLVAIDTSDLQSDNGRGLFVLNATLHNRANYTQAWPALELTLTDTSDTVVSRRVMTAADYLPPAISPEAFPANGEVAVRLWIEARNIGAAGYRLYIFYP